MHTTFTLSQSAQPSIDSLSLCQEGLQSRSTVEFSRELNYSSGSQNIQGAFLQKMTNNEEISTHVVKHSTSTVSSQHSTVNYDHRLLAKISKQFKKMTNKSLKVKNLLRSIVTDIRSNIISPLKTSSLTEPYNHQCDDLPHRQQIIQNISTKIAQTITPDCQIIRQSQFGSLLKHMTIDNDVSSDSQDLNQGIGMMYGQLLYSVGEQLMANRSKNQKVKKKRRKQSGFNKENEDFNIIVGSNKNEKVQQSINFSFGNPQKLRFDIMQ